MQGFETYLTAHAAELRGQTPATLARYLVEQIGLALSQRAAGEDPAQVEATMALALTPLR